MRERWNIRKLLGALFALLLLPTMLVAAMGTPAQALPTGVWVPSLPDGTPLQPDDEIKLTGTLSLTATFNGIPGIIITCEFEKGFLTARVPDPVPTAPPGGTIQLPIDELPDPISENGGDPGDERCSDTYTDDVDNVSSTGQTWMVNIDVPDDEAPPEDSPYTGVLTGSVEVPNNDIEVESPVVPLCVLHGPSVGTGNTHDVTGQYDTSTGEITADPNQTVPVSVKPGGTCTVGATAAITASFELCPVITLVYVP